MRASDPAPPERARSTRGRSYRPVPRPRPGREVSRRRVERLARSLPDGVRDHGLPELLHRVDQSPVLPGHRVELFIDGDAAISGMLSTIDRAEREILLESYILKDDRTGRQVTEALAAAVRRGVTVRLLADAVGSLRTPTEFWRSLESQGIAVRLFHPLRYVWRHFYRDHRKILVVDRRVAFTGGMNIGEEYGSGLWRTTGAPRRRLPGERAVWRDTHARIEGPAAWELAVVFREGWNRAGGTPFDLPRLEFDDTQPTGGAHCLVLDSRPGRGHAETALVLRALVAAARERVWVTNSYFAPSWAAITAICRAADRGLDVRLLLPGPTDVPLLRHAAHGSYARLLRHGVRIWEYQTSVLHAKTVVVDDFASVVGSSNLDFRSFAFNAECNVVVLDERIGGQLAAAFEGDLSRSCEVTRESWRRRRWRHQLYDRFARALSPVL